MSGSETRSTESGAFDGADDGSGLVTALFVLGLGNGVGDDAGAGLNVALVTVEEEGADGDTAVEVAAEVGIDDGAAVDAAADGFHLLNDLHGADLGGAGEGAGGKAGAKGVNGREAGAEAAFEGRDQVHDVGVALDEHEVFHADGAELADAAEVIAAEVDEHDVFGDLLGVGAEALLVSEIFGLVVAAGAGAGDGTVLDAAFFDADEELRGGADDVAGAGLGGFSCGVAVPCPGQVQAQAKHVGRGVHDAKGAVDFEGVDAGGAVEALREDALEDVARGDVLLGALDGGEKIGRRGSRREFEGSGEGFSFGAREWAFEQSFEFVEPGLGVVKGGGGIGSG